LGHSRIKNIIGIFMNQAGMRGVESSYDGVGCSNGVCVPEGTYYHQTGRIENEEVLTWYKEKFYS
jgi:hypothetical protein